MSTTHLMRSLPIRRVLLPVLAFALAFLPTISVYSQTNQTGNMSLFEEQQSRDPAVFRENLYRLVDQSLAIGDVAGYPADIVAGLEDSRAQLDTLSLEALGEAAEQLGPQLARLNRIMDDVKIALEEDPGRSDNVTTSTGFPDAAYPNLSWNFTVSSGGDAELESEKEALTGGGTAAGGANGGSQNDSGLCNLSQRPSDPVLFGLLTGVTVAEAVQMIASRLCEQEILGFNASALCIITDLIFLAVRAASDYVNLCCASIALAETIATYNRTGHIHGDLETAQTSITGVQTSLTTGISTIQTDITTAKTAIQTDITNLGTSLTAAINSASQGVTTNLDAKFLALGTSVNNQFTALNTSVDAKFLALNTSVNTQFLALNTSVNTQFTTLNTTITANQATLLTRLQDAEDLSLRLTIEDALFYKRQLSLFQLPAANGGHQELVRAIVVDTINQMTAVGQGNIGSANTRLAQADAFAANGNHKQAFQYYSMAYIQAIN